MDEYEDEIVEARLHDLVNEINEKGVFKMHLEWGFDAENNNVGNILGLISGGWAGKEHSFEVGTHEPELLDAILNVLNALSDLKECN
jgi:hypothetical protein